MPRAKEIADFKRTGIMCFRIVVDQRMLLEIGVEDLPVPAGKNAVRLDQARVVPCRHVNLVVAGYLGWNEGRED